MGNLELTDTLKMLSGERAEMQKDLAKLDRAITVLKELSGARAMPNGHLKKRTLSVAARRRIAKAQKLRWARVRQGKAGKA